MRPGLFIVADDLGLHPSVNEGIVSALKNGWVDAASFMMNGAAADDAVNKLKAESKELREKIGIHFVLVEEKPLALEVLPKNHKIFFIKYLLSLMTLSDIEKELRAQLNRCQQLGLKPLFINSHQHLHLLPGITNLCIKLAQENGIGYIRTVSEPLSWRGGFFRGLASVFLAWLSRRAMHKIRRVGLTTNDIFVGFQSAGNLRQADLNEAKSLASSHPDKIIELGCHPGFEDGELRQNYRRWDDYHWERELEILRTS